MDIFIFILKVLGISFMIFLILCMMLLIVHFRDDILKKRNKEEAELSKIIIEKSEHQKEKDLLYKQIRKLKEQLGELEAQNTSKQALDEALENLSEEQSDQEIKPKKTRRNK